MKKILIILVVFIFCVSFIALIANCSGCSGCGHSGGDGKTTCKNCGKKEVVALGYCRRCYDGFIKNTYGDIDNYLIY